MNSALIIVDLQNDFLGEDVSFFMAKRQSPLLSIKKTLLSTVTELVNVARKSKIQIIWIRSVYGECDLSTSIQREQTDWHRSLKIGQLEPKLCGTHLGQSDCCVRGSVGAELIPEVIDNLVDLNDDLIIEKRWYSSFFQTTLHDILKQKKIHQLFVCGVTTSTCITATSADARHLNFDVVICKEGVPFFESYKFL